MAEAPDLAARAVAGDAGATVSPIAAGRRHALQAPPFTPAPASGFGERGHDAGAAADDRRDGRGRRPELVEVRAGAAAGAGRLERVATAAARAREDLGARRRRAGPAAAAALLRPDQLRADEQDDEGE